ncbi:hypothetical protein PsYK624_065610 [Phanerochaete sordida]|uniref:Uncharacterized protein n=1 Tax=Phanerochaete sordida TaxID=48140 RepID=A0A9P3G8U7_9APHY|nr:hypothetical protein PsYK624_065610 [Phanerochaete sordida]
MSRTASSEVLDVEHNEESANIIASRHVTVSQRLCSSLRRPSCTCTRLRCVGSVAVRPQAADAYRQPVHCST